jgi:hypothetical protein
VSDEQRYYDVLKTIAKEFMSSDELRRKGPKEYGLPFEECLEMAYDNIQQRAKNAIAGKRRPKA